MNTPQQNTKYNAFRTAPIEIEMNPETKSLMAYIPYKLVGHEIEGRHSVVLGKRDGTPMENNINNLLDIFKADEIWALPDVELPQAETIEFSLSDYRPASADVKYAGFNWINPPRNTASLDEAKAMWSEKMALFSRKQAASESAPAVSAPVVNSPAAPAAEPKRRGRPPTVKAEVVRKSSQAEVSQLLCAKHGIEYDSKDAGEIAKFEKLSQEVYFKATDELFGEGKDPVTPEDYGKLADYLKL